MQTVIALFKITLKYLFIAAFCGLIYSGIELLWRGRTAPEMFLLAGICGLFICWLNNIFTYDLDYLLQIIVCGIFCTGAEWICGLLFNKDYHIWDYRGLPLSSLDGQVCLLFSLAWCLIAAFAIPLLDWIEWKIFKYKEDTPPYYMVLGRKVFEFKKG